MENNEYWILALSGGGARGLFTASILEQLEAAINAPIATKFDLIAGTSVGGILALGVAKEIEAKKLRELFTHSEEIFDRECRILNWPIFRARYRNNNLKKLLEAEDVFGKAIVGDLKHRVLIPSVNYTKGAPSFFKTPHHHKFMRDWQYSLVDVALATSAAPTFFPIHGFDHKHFVDGGLVANAPGLVAVHEALHFAGKPDIKKIHVLSIGTAGGGTSMDTSISPNLGAVSGFKSRRYWMTMGWGFRLFELTIRSQEAMSNSMMKHWLEDRHYLVDVNPQSEQTKYLGLDDVSKEAKASLLGQAKIAGQECLTAGLIERIRNHKPQVPNFYYGPSQNATYAGEK